MCLLSSTVHCDSTHAFGVNDSGVVIVHDHEQWPGLACAPEGTLTDVRLLNVALHEGMKKYAWLEELSPARPSDAQDCASCGGTGSVPIPNIICYCGGAGWVLAGDTWNEERLRR